MKTLRVLFTLALSFSLCLLSSCMDLSNISGCTNYQVLTGNVMNYDSAGKDGKSNERTILSTESLGTLYYYLYGYTDTGLVYNTTRIDDITDGIFSVKLEPGYWCLTLFASNNSNLRNLDPKNIRGEALLVGYAFADLSNHSGSAYFTLSTDGLTSAGSLNFNVSLSNSNNSASRWFLDSGETAYAEIRDLITGDVVKYTSGNTTRKNDIFTASKSSDTFGGNASLVPGSYNFVVTFTDRDRNVKAVWSDTIVVVPGRKITAPIYIPNILGASPEKPSFLTATYLTGSEDLPDSQGLYLVHFQWDNTPNNETYYELEVGDFTDNETEIFTADTWRALGSSKIVTLEKEFEADLLRYDGSFLANNTDATIYLKLGRSYQARIRAVNYSGKSDWTYATLPTGVGADIVEGYTSPLSYFAAKNESDVTVAAKTINRGRITYNLNGGVYKDMVNTNVVSRTQRKPEYFTQTSPVAENTIGVKYWDGTGYDDASTDDDLSNGGKVFKYWCSDIENMDYSHVFTKDGAGNQPYTDVRNTTVYADYVEVATPPVSSATYEFDASWLDYSAGSVSNEQIGDEGEKTVLMTLSKAAIDTGSVANIRFRFVFPEGASVTGYSGVKLEVFDHNNISKAERELSWVYNTNRENPFGVIDVKSWEAGVYMVKFTAEKRVDREILQIVNVILNLTD